jgi:hypothetical protein
MNGNSSLSNNVYLLLVGLLIGTFSIFAASSFRDFVDGLLQLSVPLSEKSLSGGSVLVAYRLLYFLIILAILVALSVILIK